MNYERISEITNVQVIAKGTGVDIRHYLNRTFGHGHWRKLKGVALVKYENNEIWLVELHWYEAHGIGKRLEKIKRRLKKQE
ncbi:MAG: hypothetical protein L0332_32130 [Chloroflexi bacterium]|nr:hypothetical protein [Chloroflexota bacterium]MCI0577236.1 hypothetical protein [Chloroflexota bacterium]MCI0646717.1 hypothetical protein [Chloroflexota bacterium]MCI0731351.1 hypothetical protein [Chloroflexota bacterium]